MKQIGFVMRSQDCDRPVGDLIEKLHQRADLKLVVVALEGVNTAVAHGYHNEESRHLIRAAAAVRWLFFHLSARVEALIARYFVLTYASH